MITSDSYIVAVTTPYVHHFRIHVAINREWYEYKRKRSKESWRNSIKEKFSRTEYKKSLSALENRFAAKKFASRPVRGTGGARAGARALSTVLLHRHTTQRAKKPHEIARRKKTEAATSLEKFHPGKGSINR